MDKIDRIVNRMIDFALENQNGIKNRVLVISMSKKTLEKILTPSRTDLIRTIRNKNPKSIGELAKITKRPLQSISRDIKILQNYGILGITKFGKRKKPKIEKDILMIPLKA